MSMHLRKQQGLSKKKLAEVLKSRRDPVENCQGCGTSLSSRTRVLDHDHETGEIRHVLCRSCNKLRESATVKGAALRARLKCT